MRAALLLLVCLSLRTLSTASHDVVNSLVLVDYAPVAEMKQLRSKQPIAVLSAEAVAPGKSLVLKASSASDIELTFEKPVRFCCIVCRTVFTCVACRNTSLAEGYSCIYMYIMRVGQICHIQHQFCWRNAVLQLHHRGGNCSSWLRHAGRKRSRSGHPCGRAPRHPSRSSRSFHQPGHWSWPKAQLDHNDGRR